jgi:rhodanese-related sulfurtransferase
LHASPAADRDRGWQPSVTEARAWFDRLSGEIEAGSPLSPATAARIAAAFHSLGVQRGTLMSWAGNAVAAHPLDAVRALDNWRGVMDAVRAMSHELTIDELLARERALLRRLHPHEACEAMSRGAVMIDTRSYEQRLEGGVVPGSIRVHRNVLEWRADPTSGFANDLIVGCTGEVIVMCQQGYSSSLAAATLQRLGVRSATDLIGGFEAWVEAGLPVAPLDPERAGIE